MGNEEVVWYKYKPTNLMTGNRCAGARVNLYGGNSGISAGQVGAA